MTKQKYMYLISALIVLLLTSACSTQSNSGSSDPVNNVPIETNQDTTTAGEDSAENSDEEILIVIDQTEKPIEGNAFDFSVTQRPEGFSLAEMQWISPENLIVNSVQEAIEHGANGEDGFYISGNGQFMGFFYSDTMKGEVGQVVFLFKNDEGEELTWKKEITLK